MGSSYLPPPEQNVVNVGDEISASSLAGIQAANPALSGSNPVASSQSVASAIAAIPIPPPPNLSGYAQLSGATFAGKVNTPSPTSSFCGLNVGSFLSTSNITGSVAGDIWIGTFQLTYRNGQGNIVYGAATNLANVFGAPQIIDTTNTAPALRVTQKGTGDAIRVEDSTTPDSTSFVVDSQGKVGIGGVVPTWLDDKVAVHDGNIVFGWPYGVRFGDGTSIYSVNALTSQIQSSVQQPIINYIFSGAAVYTGSASVYSQYLAYYDSANNVDVYVDYLSYTYDYSVAWNPSSMAFTQTNSSQSYPSQYTIVGTYTMSGGYNYGIRADGSGGVQDTIQL
jgi:hypothetical protein